MSQHTCLVNREMPFLFKNAVLGEGWWARKGLVLKFLLGRKPEKLQNLNSKCIMHIMLLKNPFCCVFCILGSSP